VVFSPIDPSSLPVPRFRETQLDGASSGEFRNGKEVALVEVGAVGGERIDLLGRVLAPAESVRGAASGAAADHDHISDERSPLALNTSEAGREIENRVIARSLANRSVDVEPEANGGECAREFSRIPFLIGGEHSVRE
jgi:hypothetical protein